MNNDIDISDNSEELIEENDEEIEDDDIEYGLKQALPVPKEEIIPKNASLETWYPSSAEEYLLWVRQEAKQYPKICVSQHPITIASGTTRIHPYKSGTGSTMTKSFIGQPKRSTTRSIEIPEILLPNQAWVDMIIEDFERVRDYLEFLRSINEQNQQQQQLAREQEQRYPQKTVTQFPLGSTDEKSWYNWCFNDRQGPRLSHLVTLDQEYIWLLLEYHSKWLQSKRLNEAQV